MIVKSIGLAATLLLVAGAAPAQAPAPTPTPSQDSTPSQGIDLSHGGPITVTARDGMDWLQNEQEVVARGDARAVRGTVTVTADTLIAHYRKKKTPAGAAATPVAAEASGGSAQVGAPAPAADDTGSNEIYRLEAIGHVHIFTPSDNAWGDKAVYDMDQAVLVLTGKHLKLTTPQDIITARDDMEYWSQKHLSVARGNAVVVTNDGKRIAADTLVAYDEPTPPSAQPAQSPAPAAKSSAQSEDEATAATHRIKRVEGYGNLDIRTATETIYADRGVYLPDRGLARVVGHVRITRGQNQVNGVAADVNLNTGISTLLSGKDARVQGLIMPNDASAAAGQPSNNPTRTSKPGLAPSAGQKKP
ncbi:MAG: hypothetical protein IRZ23_09425 [Acetobacteraceae bacterium]|nr:hypothetical protein [Acetobacteraceae bacterium]